MKIKNISIALVAMAAVALTATSCKDDDLSDQSIFAADLAEAENTSEFDKWLDINYTQTYNIKVLYRYMDNESDRSYNVIPAEPDKAKALTILIKHLWLDAYSEQCGMQFMKKYSPRVIMLTGSYKYNSNTSGESGGIVLGTADGGVKVMLYGINNMDIDHPYINNTDPYSSDRWADGVFDLNYWFFHTMHHEFCHILTQKKEYTTEFRTITAATYHAADWINQNDQAVAKEGFVSAYGSGEYNEDFAEYYATYVTMTPEAWQKIVDAAGEEGAPIMEQKIKIVREYFKNSWGIDIDKMRDCVLRRSTEALTLDLRTLK